MSGSKSSSQANQTTTTANTDNRVAADNGSVVLGSGATLETLSDDVAIEALRTAGNMSETGMDAAQSVATTATAAATKVNADSLDFAGNVVDSAASLMSRQIDASTESQKTNATLAESISSLLQENKNDTTAQTVQSVAKYAAVAVAAAAGLYFLSKTLK